MRNERGTFLGGRADHLRLDIQITKDAQGKVKWWFLKQLNAKWDDEHLEVGDKQNKKCKIKQTWDTGKCSGNNTDQRQNLYWSRCM